ISTNHTKVLSTGGAIFYNFVPGQPAPVWRGAKVTNRDAFADPEYALDAFFGPSVPTVIINPFTTLRLPHGLLLTARGEYQGGAWGQDFPSRLVAQRGPRGPVGCDDVYKIVPWASYTGPGVDRLARQREPALLVDHGSAAAAGDGDLLAQAHLLRKGGRPCGCRSYGSSPDAASRSEQVRSWCSARSPPAICRWTTPTAYR